jgi:hypothetical protein
MKTHSCFRLLTNALTGAILFTITALRAEAADQVKVTDLMTKKREQDGLIEGEVR